MNKVSLTFVAMIMLSVAAFAQQTIPENYIEVNGESRIEIIPDEIYVNATIKEDKQETFDKVEKAFLAELKKMGLGDKEISLADMQGEFASAWFKKDQMVKEKTYQVKLKSAEQVGEFLKLTDKVGAKNANIIRTNLSNRNEVEKELRIKAVKNAKEKAQYMTEAIDAEMGKVILIREQYINVYDGYKRVNNVMMMNDANVMQKGEADMVGFKKIRMEMKVQVRFELN